LVTSAKIVLFLAVINLLEIAVVGAAAGAAVSLALRVRWRWWRSFLDMLIAAAVSIAVGLIGALEDRAAGTFTDGVPAMRLAGMAAPAVVRVLLFAIRRAQAAHHRG
jgi:hypothetical protein